MWAICHVQVGHTKMALKSRHGYSAEIQREKQNKGRRGVYIPATAYGVKSSVKHSSGKSTANAAPAGPATSHMGVPPSLCLLSAAIIGLHHHGPHQTAPLHLPLPSPFFSFFSLMEALVTPGPEPLSGGL